MLFSPPKCMQQIATLIITFAVYVAGIRNMGGSDSGGGVGAIADYASYSAPYNEDFRPSQLLSETTEVISTTSNNGERRQSTGNNGNFRPSQIISFTTSDVQSTPKKYPPSYLEPNYHPQEISKGGIYGLVPYNEEEKQFVFHSEPATAASAIVSANTNIQKYLYSSAQPQSATQQTVMPAQLHTTPIFIYRDPYTNKINTSQRQHDYSPASEPIYQAQYVDAGRPQEYTVQSMMVVGAGQRPPATFNQQRPQYVAAVAAGAGGGGADGGGEYQRPGYVLDEQLRPSYNRPVYSNRYEQIPSAALPSPPTTDYNRRDGEKQTERPYEGKFAVAPTTTTKISYDSHDYPPPSYYKQQTSNFQSLQRPADNTPNYYQQSAYATSPATATTTAALTLGRPELTSSHYVNKFGNYLQGLGNVGGSSGKAGVEGYYKHPPPHYSNAIVYVTPRPPSPPQAPVRPAPPYYPQGNEPIRHPPPSANNNYYQYQLGEIPPAIQHTALGSRPQSPPGQYQTTPQHYPVSQHYQPQQSYAPTQNFPPSQNYPPPPNYRPTPPEYQPTLGGGGGGMGGFATLASIFAGAQQYAPQFSNLLLGGNGGGGGLLHALTGTRPLGAGGGRPPNMQLIKALENIARNDDLECVPKVLCNMIASQTQRGQLPDFITSPAITNFLAGFPAQSPALIYGRAALLGISGGDRSCTQSYSKCPKNEYEILYYLNNHRGGFFKFFSESEESSSGGAQQSLSQAQTQSSDNSGGTSLFSLFSALTGADPPVTTTTPRPTPRPTVASFDITQGIGNFFSNILSEYISGVEYQRRSSRAKRAISFEDEPHGEKMHLKFPEDTDSEDFHDEEDDEDTQGGVDFEDESANEQTESAEYGDTHGRVVFKSGEHSLHFFPGDDSQLDEERLKDIYLEQVINKFNAAKTGKKLKFPTAADNKVVADNEAHNEAAYTSGDNVVHFRDENEGNNSERPASGVNFRELETANSAVHFKSSRKQPTRRGKAVVFKETNENGGYVLAQQPREEHDYAYESQSGNRVLFPDHYLQHIRKGKILNKPILYASNYAEYMQNADSDHLVVSDSHRPEHNDIDDSGAIGVNYDGDKQLGPIYHIESSSSQQQHNSHSTLVQVYNDNRLHYNRGADTHSGGSSNRYTPASSSSYAPAASANYNNNRYHSSNYKRRPNYGGAAASSSSSSSNYYDYPNKNYISNNRYGSRYQTTTRAPREDNQNIYVTNAQGVTTHYITPNGHKVYL